MLVKADDQPIQSRFGDSVWLTDYITPHNPDVMLKHQQLVRPGQVAEDATAKLWEYVVTLPYKPNIAAILKAGGQTIPQKDTWFFPAEVMQIRQSNCANRSFLMASLLKNILPAPGQVYCVLGHITVDGIGAHAWVEANIRGKRYIIETTQPKIPRVLMPAERAPDYQGIVYFDDNSVYTVTGGANIKEVLNAKFGVCAIPFLRQYLCDRCLGLEAM